MSRMRVLDLAKELGIETKVAIAKLQELGVQVKNHFNAVSETDAAKLRAAVGRAGKHSEKEQTAPKATSKIFIRRKAEAAPEVPAEKPEEETPFVQPAKEETLSSEPPTAPAEAAPAAPTISEIEKIPTPKEDIVVPSAPQEPEPISVMKEDTDKKMETKQPIPPPPPAPKPPQAVAPQPRPAPSSTGGAVIVRRAEPKEASPRDQHPQHYQRREPYGGGGYNRQQDSSAGGNRDGHGHRPYGQQDSGRRPYQGHAGQGGTSSPSGQRPPYQGGSGSSYSPRPHTGQQGGYAGRPPVGGAPNKPFVMPETTTSVTKDMPSRLKDRDKDREKRKTGEEEDFRNGKAGVRGKGTRFQETEDFVEVEALDHDQEEPIVRTIIPNRKKGSSLRRKEYKKAEPANPMKASKKVIRIDESISVNDLAGELSQKATAVIKTLMKLGMMANINQQLDFDTATFVAQEFGYETQNASVSIDDILARKTGQKVEDSTAQSRPPIVTIMGHVDHGKTSLLDAIRSANVASKEAGGITQHIGAYQIEHKGHKLTFLDTPGHEAFTSMRARGAQVTDIVVLVVAADDGVMPQSIEAIAHAKAAGVPIIVAINKIDKPGINFERITKELADQGVLPEEWGGDTMFVKVSAKTHEGLDSLVEAILLQAEILDLKAPQEGLAEGVVIESKLDKARGPIATVIVTKGLLKQQDSVVVGKSMGRVRAIFDDRGQKLTVATPSTPVELIGLSEVPQAGDKFNCVASDTIAKEAVAYRIEKQRQKDLASQRGSSMEDLFALMGNPLEEKPKELSVIIKADTHGSTEAIKNSIQKLDTAKVKSKIILSAVGGITETDAILAKASHALIVGFNVRPDRMAAQYAERGDVKIQCFSIIYELIEAVKASMLGTLMPVKTEKVIGHAEVRNTFSVPKIGIIAGTMVTDGKVTRNAHIRIVRDGVVIYTGKVGSLKRFKDDAKEVAQGFECGISVENYNDLKVGDVLESYIIEETAPTL